MTKEQTDTLKRGRLSNEERIYIVRYAAEKSPQEIADDLNRTIAPVIRYLDMNYPSWREVTPNPIFRTQQEEHDESAQQSIHSQIVKLSQQTGMTFAESKRAIRTEIQPGAKTIKDLRDLVEIINQQKEFIAALVNEIQDKEEYWSKCAADYAAAQLAPERRDLELQRAKVHAELMHMHDMPQPAAPEFTKESASRYVEHGTSGIYFAWENGEVVYVGKADDIKRRLSGKHHKIEDHMPISYIKLPRGMLYRTECFYIWLLGPMLNGEIVKDSYHVGDTHEGVSESIFLLDEGRKDD